MPDVTGQQQQLVGGAAAAVTAEEQLGAAGVTSDKAPDILRTDQVSSGHNIVPSSDR